MSGDVTVVWDERLAAYDLGPEHPLRPERVLLTMALARALGYLDQARLVTAAEVGDDDLIRVHTPHYLEVVKHAGIDGRPAMAYGLGPGDTPSFRGMHEASAMVCAATVAAAGAIIGTAPEHAFSPAGGLHHAMPNRASGFCIYNDPAVAIAWMLEQGVERVAYVDVDVHHGDGVEAVFAAEPRVLTVSLHESGRYLFPGTGFANEIGEGPARGAMANLPLPPMTTDELYLQAFDAVVPELVTAFAPEVLVTQLGCDTHFSDPLAHLALSLSAYEALAERLHVLAHRAAGGRWLATGGGGYQWAEVVPRAWNAYLAEMLGEILPDHAPAAYLDEAADRYGVVLPETLREQPIALVGERRSGVVAEVDRSVSALRAALFPLHGLTG